MQSHETSLSLSEQDEPSETQFKKGRLHFFPEVRHHQLPHEVPATQGNLKTQTNKHRKSQKAETEEGGLRTFKGCSTGEFVLFPPKVTKASQAFPPLLCVITYLK